MDKCPERFDVTVRLVMQEIDNPFGENGKLALWAITDQPMKSTTLRVAWTSPDGQATTGIEPSLPAIMNPTHERAWLLGPELTVQTGPAKVAENIADGDLQNVQAAKLRLDIFDVNGEQQYSGKAILLNGQKIGTLPANERPISNWQTIILDIPKDRLSAIRSRNVLQIKNVNGDCFKFKAPTIAVKLADGRWYRTKPVKGVFCSARNWLYAEGKFFQGDVSPEIPLDF